MKSLNYTTLRPENTAEQNNLMLLVALTTIQYYYRKNMRRIGPIKTDKHIQIDI